MQQQKMKKETLCWSCANACGDCSWSDYNERNPVKGWVAEKTLIKISNKLTLDSYRVIYCPEYIQDRTESNRLRKQVI